MLDTNDCDFHALHIDDDPTASRLVRDLSCEAVAGCTLNIKNGGQEWETVSYHANLVKWEFASSVEEARRKLAHAEETRPGRGFDLVICDLQIFDFASTATRKLDTSHGLEALEARTSYSEWPGSTIVVSNYADTNDLLLQREARRRGIEFDEWLTKGELEKKRESSLTKLRRFVVPVEWIARVLRAPDATSEPLIFENRKMRRVLRDLYVISQRPAEQWPLTKLLVLGEAGSGKGAVARAFCRLLGPKPKGGLRRLLTVNCAALVQEAHGGRIGLFGSENFAHVQGQPGFFEQATQYGHYRMPTDIPKKSTATPRKNAADNSVNPNDDALTALDLKNHYSDQTRRMKLRGSQAKIQWPEADVVFLDEFALLKRDLQGAILNAVEEGVIRREGTHEQVPIGCHLIFATNVPARELVGMRPAGDQADGVLRDDLLDRIPDVIRVPSLRERDDEIEILLRHLAWFRLRTLGRSATPSPNDITIGEAALRTIRWAVREQIIRSVRHLQSIASMNPGEISITDGNLASLFRKAKLLHVRRDLSSLSSGATTAEQAEILHLPAEFQAEQLPQLTTDAIAILHQRYTKPSADITPLEQIHLPDHDAARMGGIRERLRLISLFVADIHDRLYDETVGALRNARSKILKGRNMDAGTRAKTRKSVLDILLND